MRTFTVLTTTFCSTFADSLRDARRVSFAPAAVALRLWSSRRGLSDVFSRVRTYPSCVRSDACVQICDSAFDRIHCPQGDARIFLYFCCRVVHPKSRQNGLFLLCILSRLFRANGSIATPLAHAPHFEWKPPDNGHEPPPPSWSIP